MTGLVVAYTVCTLGGGALSLIGHALAWRDRLRGNPEGRLVYMAGAVLCGVATVLAALARFIPGLIASAVLLWLIALLMQLLDDDWIDQ